MIDKNPFSQTYGCFDRSYHHYKSKSFVNSMMQCYGMILAKIYSLNLEKNPWYHDEQIKRLALASVRFTIATSRKDGSCDEHYLGEDSHVARVFSLISSLYVLLEFPEIRLHIGDYERMNRMLQWPDRHPESEIIANHIAGTILMYLLASKYFNKDYSPIVKKWVQRLSNAQHEEGWFLEYDGCDLGYQTLNNLFLFQAVRLINENGSAEKEFIKSELERMYAKSVAFLSEFITPDGTLPSGFGSRNSSHLFINGFVPFSDADKKIQHLIGKFAENYLNGTIERIEDDTFAFFPLIDSCLTALGSLDLSTKQRLNTIYSGFKEKIKESRTKDYINDIKIRGFPQSGFYILFNSYFSAFISTKPMMVVEIFDGDQLEYRTMGCSFLIETNELKIVKGTTSELLSVEFPEHQCAIVMKGNIREEQNEILNPPKHLALLFFGLFANSSLIKKILKNLLIKRIVRKKKAVIGKFDYKIMMSLKNPDGKERKNKLAIKAENSFQFIKEPKKIIRYDDFIKSEKYVPSNGYYCQKKYLSEYKKDSG